MKLIDVEWQGWQPQDRATLLFVIRDGLYDSAFAASHVSGFEALADAVAAFTPQYAARRAGLIASEIELAARTFAV